MGQGLSGAAGGRRAGFAGFRIEISPDKKKQANDRSQRGLPWGGELLKSECGRLRSAAGPIRFAMLCICGIEKRREMALSGQHSFK